MQLFDKSVSWLGWAYNEEELIGEYLVQASDLLKRTVKEYEIIIVDDGSTDRTADIIETMMKDMPDVRLIRNNLNMNVGYSFLRALNSAKKDFVFWQTIDWSYDISNLRHYLELLKTYDIVAGVRREPVEKADAIIRPIRGLLKLFNIQHLTKRSDTFGKALISVINYCLIRCLFNVPLSDYQNVVFYPTKHIQSMNYESKSSFGNPEGLFKSYWSGATIVEVPISFIPRRIGTAKGTRIRAVVASVWDIVRLWWKWIVLGRRGYVRKGVITRLNPQMWKCVELIQHVHDC